MMTHYNFIDLGTMASYLWTVEERDDDVAHEYAITLISGAEGRLYRGPTGEALMDYVGVVYRPHREIPLPKPMPKPKKPPRVRNRIVGDKEDGDDRFK